MPKKVSQTVYLSPEQIRKLRLLSERTRVPMAVYVREGIDFVLEKIESQETENEEEETKVGDQDER